MSQPCVGLCSWTVWNTSQKDYENNTISGALESRECLLPFDWQKSISPCAKQKLIPMPFVGCKRKSCKHWPLPSTFLICCVAVPGLSPSQDKSYQRKSAIDNDDEEIRGGGGWDWWWVLWWVWWVWWVSLRANHDHEDHPNASGN